MYLAKDHLLVRTYPNDIMIPEVAVQQQVARDRPFKYGISKIIDLDIMCTELIGLREQIHQSFPCQNPFCTYSPKFYPARILHYMVSS